MGLLELVWTLCRGCGSSARFGLVLCGCWLDFFVGKFDSEACLDDFCIAADLWYVGDFYAINQRGDGRPDGLAGAGGKDRFPGGAPELHRGFGD